MIYDKVYIKDGNFVDEYLNNREDNIEKSFEKVDIFIGEVDEKVSNIDNSLETSLSSIDDEIEDINLKLEKERQNTINEISSLENMLRSEIVNTEGKMVSRINSTNSRVLKLERKTEGLSDYVIETGKNSNGTWEKWNSGKLVQRGRLTLRGGTGSAWGPLYYRYVEGKDWVFPIDFVDEYVTVSATKGGGGAGVFHMHDGVFKTQVTGIGFYRVNDSFGSSSNYYPVAIEAIGRWK